MWQTGQADIFVAGAVAAFTVDILVYPLDTIKTRYQSQGSISHRAGTSSGTHLRYSAARGLYQGIGSVVLATLPAAAIFFATYESAKSMLGRTLPETIPQPAHHAIASAGAEMASCIILTPAEIIKQNAQVIPQSWCSRMVQSSSVQALRILRHNKGGVTRTLWSGYTTLVARNLPFTAMQFPIFEYVRNQIWVWRQRRTRVVSASPTAGATTRDSGRLQSGESIDSLLIETGLVAGSAAAIAGSLAAFITTPADVVKTMVMLGARESSDHPRRQSSGSIVARAILRDNGVRGLFRGATLRATWAALGSGLYLGSYEVAKVWMKNSPS